MPRGGGAGQLLLQPGQLGIADHVAAGIPPGLLNRGQHQLLGDGGRQSDSKGWDGGGARRWREAELGGVGGHQRRIGQNRSNPGLYGRCVGIGQLLIASGEPGFEDVQRQHIAEAEGAVPLGEGRKGSGAITGLA